MAPGTLRGPKTPNLKGNLERKAEKDAPEARWDVREAQVLDHVPEREKILYWQPTGPNSLNHRGDFGGPAVRRVPAVF